MAEIYSFDEFFTPDDAPGIEAEVLIRGKILVFEFKRGINFRDGASARAAAAKTRINPATQMPEMYAFDEAVFNIELLARTIKKWPFHQNGQPLPVTRELLQIMDTDMLEPLVRKVQEIMSNKGDYLANFGKQSDAAS